MALRPDDPTSRSQPLVAVRVAATTTIPIAAEPAGRRDRRPRHARSGTPDDVATLAHRATGGNPFYLREFLRALERAGASSGPHAIEDVVGLGGVDGVALQLRARLQRLNPAALHLAQALAILGDGCDLRHAAAVAAIAMDQATYPATIRYLARGPRRDRPPRSSIPRPSPVVQTLSPAEQDAAHRAVARVPARGARAAGSGGSTRRCAERRRRVGGRAPARGGEGRDRRRRAGAAADLLERALAELPPRDPVDVLCEAARAQQLAGRE
jgi:hypothetical protein